MGRKPVKNKKQPADYPLISFRIELNAKERVTKKLKMIQERLNKKRIKTNPFISKNEIFLVALEHGLDGLDWNEHFNNK